MKGVHDPTTNEHGKPEEYFGKVEIEMLDPFQTFGGNATANATYKAILYDA
jgi:hypothetical protein